ncbi:Serpentine Receptor, class U [Caenorhabditis elegans]|uniref:Serpentine Receptor, class U n=1 Tax=Caenorhabditis elegans TaxID=6239 RepID=A0A0K3AUU6_CAEEL|nr:Serpentine Receptor, class U [Caenorhabditis elegans]CTQ86790.1 Serpentine Receptor, class U [Caenorhabditis elegans]|eukprot:NP_001300091.1 Serpentine Receptor, class U [Caenorhabditis elegans]
MQVRWAPSDGSISILFFVSEFLYLRLPMTGLLTNWCASVEPNGYLIVLTVTTYYLNYSLMLFPFLVALLRLNLIVFPSQHRKINETILKISIPIVFIYPFFFTFFMFTGSGYCTYMDYFLSSGALVMRITETLFGITNTYPLMFNTFFWFSTSFTINLILIWKLIHYKLTLSAHAKSQKPHKAEISLTLTTISMTCSYLTNGMITICGLFFPRVVLYLIVLRPFTNDLEICLVPWVLYLTHPIFVKKKESDNIILVSSVEKLQA